ncbi:prolipoprotein diacylglyceryl transferase [Acetobacter tropicalis]|uniref:prolipoprotein diacylglyceryl transferase n=1 Tax=Acetobacter tropicalis TaxID=104102 RepID=UPI0009ED70AB|nr:prolipoprotein diacylglyceryl transferase [Acetobacter tropicalis]
MLIPYPNINPVFFSILGIPIRWYGISYIAGILFSLEFSKKIMKTNPFIMSEEKVDELYIYGFWGVLLGGRIGYILFYDLYNYINNPIEIIKIWHGGMSSHGGFIGVTIAICYFSIKNNLKILSISDRILVSVPVGLGLGRLANFVNQELIGRIASEDALFKIIYPNYGLPARYPSELFEAFGECLFLFIIMFSIFKFYYIRIRRGVLTGVFLFAYGLVRVICENFRQPDSQVGFLYDGITMGQILSVPLCLTGLTIIAISTIKHNQSILKVMDKL